MLHCFGEILVDIFIDGDKKTILPGGAPFNVACNALLYTKEVAFIGAVGKDQNGKLLIDTAKSKPFKYINIKELDNRNTSEAIVSLDNGERSFRFNRDLGADYMLDINDIDLSLIKDDDIVHIGSLMLSYEKGQEFFFNLINKIRSTSKAKISFDINYRDDIFSSPKEAKNIFLKALKSVDILKFSEEEVSLFSDKVEIGEALKEILNENQIATVTLGSKGSLLFYKGKIHKVDTYKVKPVDTTGAGDAFYSYFLASLVNNPSFIDDELLINKYLKRANVAGGLTTLKKGAINSAPNEQEINEFIKNN